MAGVLLSILDERVVLHAVMDLQIILAHTSGVRLA
jgi:hypothetical protein